MSADLAFLLVSLFHAEKSFQLFIPEIFFGVPLLLCLVFIHMSLFYYLAFCPVLFR